MKIPDGVGIQYWLCFISDFGLICNRGARRLNRLSLDRVVLWYTS